MRDDGSTSRPRPSATSQRSGWLRLAILVTSLAAWVAPAETSAPEQHQRLRLRNDFKTPEEVVRYYCARDASGFVWSGLLDSERKAFTLWEDVPQQDSFYIARKYEIIARPMHATADRATVEVRYELTGIGDAHGTRMPTPKPEMRVLFDLKKVNGTWKILKPEVSRISPVVLESKFPSATF